MAYTNGLSLHIAIPKFYKYLKMLHIREINICLATGTLRNIVYHNIFISIVILLNRSTLRGILSTDSPASESGADINSGLLH